MLVWTLKSLVPKNEIPATAREVGDVPTNFASSSEVSTHNNRQLSSA